jgi:hypothetical protein
MSDSDDANIPAQQPLPSLPDLPLEEIRKGFAVLPTQPAQPFEMTGPLGGMPAPEPASATPAPAQPAPTAPPSDQSE